MTANVEGDFVVFLIGMRINSFWQVQEWLPVFLAMPKMLRELSAQKNLGLLGFRTRWGGRNIEVIQYWRSFAELLAYARSPDNQHLPAWSNFNQKIADNGSVGIWHETYLIKEKQYEAIYRNVPPYGLAAATSAIPATGSLETATDRLSRSKDKPVDDTGDAIAKPELPS